MMSRTRKTPEGPGHQEQVCEGFIETSVVEKESLSSGYSCEERRVTAIHFPWEAVSERTG